jgi:hypothetical protein
MVLISLICSVGFKRQSPSSLFDRQGINQIRLQTLGPPDDVVRKGASAQTGLTSELLFSRWMIVAGAQMRRSWWGCRPFGLSAMPCRGGADRPRHESATTSASMASTSRPRGLKAIGRLVGVFCPVRFLCCRALVVRSATRLRSNSLQRRRLKHHLAGRRGGVDLLGQGSPCPAFFLATFTDGRASLG